MTPESPTPPKKIRREKDHALAMAARARVDKMIDAVPPDELVGAIKRAPSLRGMILGYIAEEMFEKYLGKHHLDITNIEKHDDHNREENKSDRSITFKERRYTVQLKSVQTNSITYCPDINKLYATVQNDASDARKIKLPNGNTVLTTCYKKGDYDILAVPLFPFTGEWRYAYKRNDQCRTCQSAKYSPEDRIYLLSTTEVIHWPLTDEWTEDLKSLLTDSLGKPILPTEPGGFIN